MLDLRLVGSLLGYYCNFSFVVNKRIARIFLCHLVQRRVSHVVLQGSEDVADGPDPRDSM